MRTRIACFIALSAWGLGCGGSESHSHSGFGAGGSSSSSGSGGNPEQHDLVVHDVMLVDGTGKAPRKTSVVVDGGRITEIVEGSAAPPDAAEVVEGDGRYLVPGFVDLITHVSAQSAVSADVNEFIDPIAQLADDLRGVVEEPDQEKRLAGYEDMLRASLRGGVTTFVDSITSVDDVTALAKRLDDTTYPNFHSLGPILSPPGGHPPYLDGTDWKRELPISDPFSMWEQALRDDLESWLGDGGPLSGVKVAVDSTEVTASGQVPKEALVAICEVAHAHDKPCFFLSFTEQGMIDAAEAGADAKLQPPIIIGPFGIEPTSAAIWQAFSDNGVALLSLVSTVDNLERYVTDPALLASEPNSRYPDLPQDVQGDYDTLMSSFAAVADQPPDWQDPVSAFYHGSALFADSAVASLAEAKADHGLDVIPTTSAGSPFVFHGTLSTELTLLHADVGLGPGREGFMTTDEAIQAVTLTAARVVHLDKDVGSVEVGKKADLVLLGGDPYADPTALTDIAIVVKGGAVVDAK